MGIRRELLSQFSSAVSEGLNNNFLFIWGKGWKEGWGIGEQTDKLYS